MDYDEILDQIGHFSNWHKWQFAILTLYQTAAVFATLSYSFTGRKMGFYQIIISIYLIGYLINSS